MRTAYAIVVASVLAGGGLAADGSGPRFEVATVKLAPPPAGDSYPITLGLINGTRLTFTNVTLSDCVKFAYGLASDEQIAGPDWIWSKALLYDIVAVVSPEAPRHQVMAMTQSLLAERLGLVVHHEQKEMRYLALVPGKNGPKMRAADTTQERNNSAGRGHLTGNRASMDLVAMLLSRLEHQIVVDQTGLTGEFEVALKWVPGSGETGPAPDDTPQGSSLFTAIQEQLGLRLEARKGPLDVVVVDRAEKTPAEN